jgi:hypothetical protein
MMTMTKNDFNGWFERLFGKPPFKDEQEEQAAREEIVTQRIKLDHLEREMRRHEMHEARRMAALFAWQAPRLDMLKSLAKTKPQ